MRTLRLLSAMFCFVFVTTFLPAHDVFMMNSNHTDYNWNATAAVYDAAMLQELDFYLAQIAATAGAPAEEQARYVPDNWHLLRLYEVNRTPSQFQQLIDAIHSGHITIPLNPFVTLYGAMSTEATIRAGYYPGRIERQHEIDFRLAEAMENHTSPWGLSSIWAGSGVEYTWKGVCNCVTRAPLRTDDELFFWEGPDGKTLLFKWYNILGDNRDWGGYSEARNNLSSPGQIDDEITRTNSRQPGIPVTGLFGAGWDDVLWDSTAVVDAVAAYNATGTGDRAIVSNGIDFFEALEASGQTSSLNSLRGGWGNDWDMWPASLAERTSRARRAVERLRTAEMLSVYAQLYDASFWAPARDSIENGLFSLWKYFDHVFAVATGGPSLAQMQADKLGWVQDMESAVSGMIVAAEASIAPRFATPDEDRVVVLNPLGFTRTDFAQFEVAGPGPYVVTDVATALEVPSQLYARDGTTYLRFLATDVPPLGHRVYRWASGTPASLPDAATVTPGTQTIESALYRIVLGTRAQIVDATHLATATQLAGSNGLNDYGSGTVSSVSVENLGPVSVTLRIELTGPTRAVRVTLYRDIDRVDIENAITQNVSGTTTYSFHAGLTGAQIRFEEIGAVARPGLGFQGGDFLQATRANRMTLNHFADFEIGGFNLVLSNWDSYAMQVNDSTEGSGSTFDLTGDTLHVIVTDSNPGAGTTDQAGDSFFLNRFALRGIPLAFDGAEALRTSLGHQNPLHVVELDRNQSGPITDATASLLSIDAENVVITAFKPAEDPGAGFVARFWEMGDQATDFAIDASAIGADAAWLTTLIETDLGPVPVTDGVIQVDAGANEIVAYRFTVDDFPFWDTDEDGSAPADGDCDDDDPDSYPGAAELCDGNDNACAGTIPTDEQDQDGDHYVACTGWLDGQGDDPEILGGGDCDETSAEVNPDGVEVCNGFDDDCDDLVDEDALGEDTDGDLVPNLCDNCRDMANGDQADTDLDSFGNVCDNCPFQSNPDQSDTDGDGVGNFCDPILWNFGPESSPEIEGYKKDTGRIFDPALGHGWNLGVASRERMTSEPKELDTHARTTPVRYWTAEIPNGDYALRVVSGDAALSAGPHRIALGETTVIDDALTEASDYAENTVPMVVREGQFTLTVGGSGAVSVLNLVEVVEIEGAPQVLTSVNFQPAESPIPPGYLADNGEMFDEVRGYGWNLVTATRDRGEPVPGVDNTLARALNPRTWELVLPDGFYDLFVTVGDARYDQGPQRLIVEGDPVVDGETTNAGVFLRRTRLVRLTDGRLTIEAGGGGGRTALCQVVVAAANPDLDGDGVPNTDDNCYDLANSDQADLDTDGIGDVCDDDRDGDGVPNDTDLCPDAADPGQADTDGDGVGDACNDEIDSDGDEWADTLDVCPEMADPNQSDMDGDDEGDRCDLDDGVIYITFELENAVGWQEEVGYLTWNAYRGDLAVLSGTGDYTQTPGSNGLAGRDCGLASPLWQETGAPDPGDVAFFLVTGVNAQGESGLGDDGDGAPRPNANPCP